MRDSWRRRWRSGPVIVTPWARYARRRLLFWRLRIPLWLAGGAVGWLIGAAANPAPSARAATVGAGLAMACLAEVAFCYRPVPAGPARSGADEAGQFAALRDRAIRMRQRRENDAVPSPGGWTAPSGTLPAWNWAPPGGIVPRADRAPVWVRVWYRTPFADRYAYAWMWHHGGWHVRPPANS